MLYCVVWSVETTPQKQSDPGWLVHPDGDQANFMQIAKQNAAAFLPLPQLPTQSSTCVSTVGGQAFFNVTGPWETKNGGYFASFLVLHNVVPYDMKGWNKQWLFAVSGSKVEDHLFRAGSGALNVLSGSGKPLVVAEGFGWSGVDCTAY